MYERYYNLQEKPFSPLPDAEFLYLSEQHRAALASLRYGLQDQVGFIIITGEIGCGKTTLARYLLRDLGQNTNVGYIADAQRTPGEIVESCLLALNVDYTEQSLPRLRHSFVTWLVDEYEGGRRTVLIVDEAQSMSADAFEELRTLSNVNAGKRQILKLVFLGQPGLRELLRLPELEQFAQRVAVHEHLGPLNEAETLEYIRHRIAHAGGDLRLFTTDACRIAHRACEGVPRRINRLCDMALVYGYGNEKPQIDADLILLVAMDASHGGLIDLPEGIASLAAEQEHSSKRSADDEIGDPSNVAVEDYPEPVVAQPDIVDEEHRQQPALDEPELAPKHIDPQGPNATDRGRENEQALEPESFAGAPMESTTRVAVTHTDDDGPVPEQSEASAQTWAAEARERNDPAIPKHTAQMDESAEVVVEYRADQPSGQPVTGEQEEVSNSTTDFLQKPAPAKSVDAPVETADEPPNEHRAPRWRSRIITTVALAAIGLTVSAAFIHEQYDIKALWTEYVKMPLLEFTTSNLGGRSPSSPPADNDVVADSSASQATSPAQAQQPDMRPDASSEPNSEENGSTLQSPSLADIASLTQAPKVAEPESPSATTEITRLLEIAARQERNGRLEEALTTVEQAMEIDRQHADVRSMQADVVQAELVRKIAERARQQAELDEHKRRVATINEAIQVNLDTGNLEDAELLVAEGLNLDPNDERLGSLQAELERQQEASEQEKLRSKLAELREQALRHERNGETRQALELVDHARELAPNDPEIAALKNRLDNTLAQQAREQEEERQRLLEIRRLVNEATQARNSGELADALASIDQALAIDSSHAGLTDSRAVLVEAIAERDRTRQEEARQRRELEKATAQIEQHLEAGELEAAASLLDQKLTAYPRHERLNALRTGVDNALAEQERKRAEQARRERETAQLLAAARHEQQAGNLTAAISLIGQGLQIEPNHPELIGLRQEVADLAAQERRRLENSEATARVVEQELKSGDLEGAMTLLDQHLAENPHDERLAAFRTEVENALEQKRKLSRAEEAKPRTVDPEESSRPTVEPMTSSLEREKDVKTELNAQSQGESPTALAEEYMRLGNTMLDRGDVASARLFYQSAIEEGHERAMITVGSTYDPVAIKLRGLVVHTNPVEAAEWYQRAARRGYAEADEHLETLRRWFADHKHTLEAREAKALEDALTRP